MAYESDKNRVGWICTYTPEELIYAAGFIPVRLLTGSEKDEKETEDLLPANICPFVRQILGNIRSNNYSNLTGVVVVQSCNAMMHLYNALKESFDGFVYLLDVPRKHDQEAISFFIEELDSFLAFLESKSKPLESGALNKSIGLYNRRINLIKELMDNYSSTIDNNFSCGIYGLSEEASSNPPADFINKLEAIFKDDGPKLIDHKNGQASLMLSGGIPPHSLVKMLSSKSDLKLYPETCTGLRYLLRPPIRTTDMDNLERKEALFQLACNYLKKAPCPRMLDYTSREKYYEHLIDELKIQAVVYHDLMFCDLCHYDYLLVKDLLEKKEIPHLKVRTELGHEDWGQLQTRVEAFLEIIQ